MRKIREVISLIRVNARTMAEFEILYKILSLAIFTPLFVCIFNGIMRITGYRYLTIENIVPFFTNPLTIAALLVLFVCMTVYAMVDIGAVIFLLDCSYQGKKADLVQTLRFSVQNAVRVFHRKNISVAFLVLFLIPFLNIGVAPGYVGAIAVPEFILDFIAANGRLLFLFTVFLLVLGLLLFRWLYVLHYYTLEGCSFREARKKSADLGRKRKGSDLLALLGIQAGIAFLFFAFAAVGVFLAVCLGQLFYRLKWFGIVSASVVWVFLAVSILIVLALGTPVSYACISILFYRHKAEKGEALIHCEPGIHKEREKRKKFRHALESVFMLAAVAGCSVYMYGVYNHEVSLQIEYVRTMEVTAHRGACADYPENTMAAFEGARALGADWIELDVQQSRDGELIVMHDTSFLRTAGVEKNTWETDFEEMQTFDVGSFFDSRFSGERVPLLSDVIRFAKKFKLRLNIELKPSGHEENLEQSVAKLIREERFQDQCVVTSQFYDVLERVKACDSRIQTVYVMSIAYGDFGEFAAADHFSVEAENVTEKLVSDIHNAGKEIYAWTVNTRENIDRMIDLNVDNIITDDVTLAKACIFESRTGDAVSGYVKWLLRFFPES